MSVCVCVCACVRERKCVCKRVKGRPTYASLELLVVQELGQLLALPLHLLRACEGEMEGLSDQEIKGEEAQEF